MSNAIVIAPKRAQLSLLSFGDMDEATRTVFSENVKKEEGTDMVLASSLKLNKRKDIAILAGLDPKADAEALDELILKGKDELLNKMAVLMARIQSDEFWTGGNLRVVNQKPTKSGKLSKAKVIFTVEESRRPSGPTLEQIAKKLHLPIEKVQEMYERQIATLRQQEQARIKQEAEQAEQQQPEPEEEPAGVSA